MQDHHELIPSSTATDRPSRTTVMFGPLAPVTTSGRWASAGLPILLYGCHKCAASTASTSSGVNFGTVSEPVTGPRHGAIRLSRTRRWRATAMTLGNHGYIGGRKCSSSQQLSPQKIPRCHPPRRWTPPQNPRATRRSTATTWTDYAVSRFFSSPCFTSGSAGCRVELTFS
ncbi:Uncharacterised protein [Mycobacteroides abscessus subsp. massiliense]|nr:Uncharacterised protein [Mycobacteroides abscessus subsp. massiliense]